MTVLRHAARRLLAQPWRALATVVTLSVAVGVGTITWSVIDAFLWNPVPFPKADNLVLISMRGQSGGPYDVSRSVYQSWHDLDVFAGVEAAVPESVLVESDQAETSTRMAKVSPGLFALLGAVKPKLGRLFLPEDAIGNNGATLIGEDLWRKLFGGSAEILGKAITINHQNAVVVGVLPTSFRFPTWNTAMWQASRFEDNPNGSATRVVAYARVSGLVSAQAALDAATATARRVDPKYRTWKASATSLADVLSDRYYTRSLPLLGAGVAFLCLTLVANAVALRLLATSTRLRDLAVTKALGASQSRIVAESIVEALLLCWLGVCIGLVIATGLANVARGLLENAALVKSLKAISVDWRAVTVAVAIGVVTTVLVGGSTVFTRVGRASGDMMWLRGAGEIVREHRWSREARRILVAFQVSMTVVLSFSAILLIRSFVSLAGTDPGFDPTAMRAVPITFPVASFPSPQSREVAGRILQGRASTISGIAVAAWSYGTPPDGGLTDAGTWVSDTAGAAPQEMSVHRLLVQPEFFSAYGLKILAGRSLDATDGPTQVVISERLASRLWPAGSSVGRTFIFDRTPFRVVGVVGEVRFPSLDDLDLPQWYVRLGELAPTSMLTFGCHGRCPDDSLIRRRLIDSGMPIKIGQMYGPDDVYRRELAKPEALASFALLLAGTAICAGAAGLFSLLAQYVTDRRRELALRACMGAPRGALILLVWREASTVVIPGVILGALAAYAARQFLSSVVSDPTLGPAFWVSLLAVLGAFVLVATWIPLRAATHVAPIILLRE